MLKVTHFAKNYIKNVHINKIIIDEPVYPEQDYD